MKQKYTSHLASDEAGGDNQTDFDGLSGSKQAVLSVNNLFCCPFFFSVTTQIFTHRQHEDGSSGSWQTVSTGKAGTTRRALWSGEGEVGGGG